MLRYRSKMQPNVPLALLCHRDAAWREKVGHEGVLSLRGGGVSSLVGGRRSEGQVRLCGCLRMLERAKPEGSRRSMCRLR